MKMSFPKVLVSALASAALVGCIELPDEGNGSGNGGSSSSGTLGRYVVVDALTPEINNHNYNPVYLINTQNGYRINLKDGDESSSNTRNISISPNGRFVFYFQEFSDFGLQANVYDTQTARKYIIKLDSNFGPNEGIDSKNLDRLAIMSHWSNDSSYLALLAPQSHKVGYPSEVYPHNVTGTESDRLYWVDTSAFTGRDQEVVPNEYLVRPDATFSWSDNEVEKGHKPYGALVTSDTVEIFYPETAENEHPLQIAIEGGQANSFTAGSISQVDWATNNLFYLAKNRADAAKVDLFASSPKSKTTIQINNDETSPVASFRAYEANQVAFKSVGKLFYFDGSQSDIDVRDCAESSDTTANNVRTEVSSVLGDYRWSPQGHALGVESTRTTKVTDNNKNPAEISSTIHNQLCKWSPFYKSQIKNLSDTDGSNTDPIVSWQWDVDHHSVSVLDVASEKKNTLEEVNTEVSFAGTNSTPIKSDILHNKIITANFFNSALNTQLLRSPKGEWQTYWNYDSADATNGNIDLWAYNTISNSDPFNVSDLAAGQKANAAGFAVDTQAWVNAVHFLTEDLVAFEVTNLKQDPIETKEEIMDVRVVNLANDSTPYSIIKNIENITKIKGVYSY